MTIIDYDNFASIISYPIGVIELVLISLVILRQKNMPKPLFGAFITMSAIWLWNSMYGILGLVYDNTFWVKMNILLIFVIEFWFYIFIYCYLILKDNFKKWGLPISIIYLIPVVLISIYNIHHGNAFHHNIKLVMDIVLLPLSIYVNFQLFDDEQKFKWYLTPAFLINSGILIKFSYAGTFDLFSSFLSKNDQSILAIMLTLRLIVWGIFILFITFGVYFIGRETKTSIK